MASLVVFTIGHSTRPLAAFIGLLKAHGIQRVIDVRTIPRSRHNPQFGRGRLSPALHSSRIHYRHLPGLGGLRHARPNSTNTAWRNASFRGYADYMPTRGIEVREIANAVRTRAHTLTPWARVKGTQVTYPATPPEGSRCTAQRTRGAA